MTGDTSASLSLTVARGIASARGETYRLLARAHHADADGAAWQISVERAAGASPILRVVGIALNDVTHSPGEPELVRARADEFEIRFSCEGSGAYVHFVGSAHELRALVVAGALPDHGVALKVEADDGAAFVPVDVANRGDAAARPGPRVLSDIMLVTRSDDH